MLRYAAIIVGALALGVYVLVLAARGNISGRFRTVSLVLLALFLLLAGIGLYTTQTRYSVQSVQEEYSSRQGEILTRISELYSQEDYSRARELAEKYQRVNDPRLDAWYRRSREAELTERIDTLPDTAYEERLAIWEELYKLTSKEEYATRLRDARSTWRKSQEELLTKRINALPSKALAQKALGYELLMELNPGRVLYKQRHRAYVQQMEARIQDTPWSNLCASRTMDPCRHVGHRVESVQGQTGIKVQTAEICGVSWRPKGTLISRDGQTAPENGTYFLVHDWDTDMIVLINTAYVRVSHPYPDLSTRLVSIPNAPQQSQ
ncbi:hypothetical protein [Desulfovermiculus halophilus]|jgi:hypothetical protein|uniref:hypothetical protein n=1 Tax=Desulfovermiculus halophilus TaxID=339722 RepID=UPI00047FD1C7|nr:hypothetical protein [Desulfovermiculus halophilus]